MAELLGAIKNLAPKVVKGFSGVGGILSAVLLGDMFLGSPLQNAIFGGGKVAGLRDEAESQILDFLTEKERESGLKGTLDAISMGSQPRSAFEERFGTPGEFEAFSGIVGEAAPLAASLGLSLKEIMGPSAQDDPILRVLTADNRQELNRILDGVDLQGPAPSQTAGVPARADVAGPAGPVANQPMSLGSALADF